MPTNSQRTLLNGFSFKTGEVVLKACNKWNLLGRFAEVCNSNKSVVNTVRCVGIPFVKYISLISILNWKIKSNKDVPKKH